ncbi:MAG: hypothetical protein ACKO15_03025 [Burkholderiales bacterium]
MIARLPPAFAQALHAAGRRAIALRRTAVAYLLLVAVSMSLAAGLSKFQAPRAAKLQPNADCHRDKAPGCVRPTLG